MAEAAGTRSLLTGRDDEHNVLLAMLDGVEEAGAALVLRADAGMGKSVLLQAACDAAARGGVDVLRTAGVLAERDLPYAGLHRLLRPVLGWVDALPGAHREVLRAAFGAEDRPIADRFLVAVATLELLGTLAVRRPLLVVADDVQWLDPASRDVVAFVARRIESERIVVLAALRDGYDASVGDLGLPERVLEPLDVAAAQALLDAQPRAAGLTAAVRERLLRDAAGNPLALVELPTAATARAAGATAGGALLPITARLERAFAGRARDLPPDTRMLLLVAAAAEAGSVSEVLDAATVLLGRRPALSVLQPAIDARLLELDADGLRFRHPLVRSAVYQAAELGRRHAAHAALADVLAGQPDRRAWHRAEAAVGRDDAAAREVEEMAWRSHRRGAVLQAATLLARAGRLSEDVGQRGQRLLRAGELAFELGRADLVRALVEEAQGLALDPRDRARADWLAEAFHDGVPGDAQRVLLLLEHAQRAVADADADLALKLLLGAGLRCWWADPGRAVREQVLRVAERVPVDAAEPRLLATIALVAPFARGSAVVERVPRAARAAAGDPHSGHLVGMAAHAVGDFDAALRVFGATAEGLREQGRLGLLAHVLGMRSWAAFLLGDWWLAGAASAEGVRLAGETDQPIWRAGATMALAALAGARGDDERAQALVAEAERIVLPRRISALLALVQTVRGITALTAGRPDDAHAQLARAFDPADPAYHPREQYGAVGLLADAAALSGRPGPARAIVEELGRRAAPSSAPGLVLGLDYARAVLAEDADAEPRFTAALEAVGLPRAFDRARLELAFGMWLRRHGRVVESREQLRPALDGFDRLDARPWADRARRELRAAGERRGARRREAWDDLSPQEQQIARMAAGGLSNREIGQRLYLSHRTVANHLYRTFPKLGVTSRAQLGRTLPEAGA